MRRVRANSRPNWSIPAQLFRTRAKLGQFLFACTSVPNGQQHGCQTRPLRCAWLVGPRCARMGVCACASCLLGRMLARSRVPRRGPRRPQPFWFLFCPAPARLERGREPGARETRDRGRRDCFVEPRRQKHAELSIGRCLGCFGLWGSGSFGWGFRGLGSRPTSDPGRIGRSGSAGQFWLNLVEFGTYARILALFRAKCAPVDQEGRRRTPAGPH